MKLIGYGRKVDAHLLVTYSTWRRAKANYKCALHQVHKDDLCTVSNDLEECLLKKDHLSFWKTWNAKFSCKRNVPVYINGSSNNEDIANLFATF